MTYSLGLLPLGGFNAIPSLDGDAMEKQVSLKLFGKRFFVLFAGSGANLASAYVCLACMMLFIGASAVSPTIASVSPGHAAENLIQPQDKIVSINGRPVGGTTASIKEATMEIRSSSSVVLGGRGTANRCPSRLPRNRGSRSASPSARSTSPAPPRTSCGRRTRFMATCSPSSATGRSASQDRTRRFRRPSPAPSGSRRQCTTRERTRLLRPRIHVRRRQHQSRHLQPASAPRARRRAHLPPGRAVRDGRAAEGKTHQGCQPCRTSHPRMPVLPRDVCGLAQAGGRLKKRKGISGFELYGIAICVGAEDRRGRGLHVAFPIPRISSRIPNKTKFPSALEGRCEIFRASFQHNRVYWTCGSSILEHPSCAAPCDGCRNHLYLPYGR